MSNLNTSEIWVLTVFVIVRDSICVGTSSIFLQILVWGWNISLLVIVQIWRWHTEHLLSWKFCVRYASCICYTVDNRPWTFFGCNIWAMWLHFKCDCTFRIEYSDVADNPRSWFVYILEEGARLQPTICYRTHGVANTNRELMVRWEFIQLQQRKAKDNCRTAWGKLNFLRSLREYNLFSSEDNGTFPCEVFSNDASKEP